MEGMPIPDHARLQYPKSQEVNFRGQGDIVDLPTLRDTVEINGLDMPVLRSFWLPTIQEVDELSNGAYIMLAIFGTKMPPVTMYPV